MRTVILASWFVGGVAHAGTLYTVRTADDTLLSFDTRTRVLSVVGPLGVDFDFGSLAWDPTTSTMFMVPGRALQNLYELNVRTGTATFIGAHGVVDLFSLAVDPSNGALYGGQASQGTGFWSLNKRTGVATRIGDPGFGMSGAEWDPQGRGVLTNAIGTSDFFVVDVRTAAATQVGSGGVWLNDGGIAYDSDTRLLYSFDWSGNIHSFDPANGYAATTIATGLASMDGAASADGGEFQPDMLLLNTFGYCPGQQSWEVQDATPFGQVAVVYAQLAGDGVVPSGNCAGTRLPVLRPRLLGKYRADANGVVTFSGTSLPQHCGGLKLVAVDLDSCGVSNINTP